MCADAFHAQDHVNLAGRGLLMTPVQEHGLLQSLEVLGNTILILVIFRSAETGPLCRRI